jgi:hypothetical protein
MHAPANEKTCCQRISTLHLFIANLTALALALFVGGATPRPALAGPLPGLTPARQPASQQGAQNTATPPSRPNLAGTWKLNKDQSDDPRQKMQASLNQQGGGGGGGMGGGRRRGGQGGQGGGMLQEYSQLTITQTDSKTQVIGDSGRILALDSSAANSANSPSSTGSNSSDADANSAPLAQWQGSQLIATEQTRRGTTTRTYELSPDGKQLYVTTQIDSPRFSQPVTIRFVYDPVKPGG